MGDVGRAQGGLGAGRGVGAWDGAGGGSGRGAGVPRSASEQVAGRWRSRGHARRLGTGHGRSRRSVSASRTRRATGGGETPAGQGSNGAWRGCARARLRTVDARREPDRRRALAAGRGETRPGQPVAGERGADGGLPVGGSRRRARAPVRIAAGGARPRGSGPPIRRGELGLARPLGERVARSLLRRPSLAPALPRLAWRRRAARRAIDAVLEALVDTPCQGARA